MSKTIAELRDEYRSHQHKHLHVHMQGVIDRVVRSTTLKNAETSAIFHDLGKLNPNFQPKLKGEKVSGYSSHAYLSAYAFLCFYATNQEIAKNALSLKTNEDVFQVMALIARHHGNLPNFENILSKDERQRLADFLDTQPCLPISEYLEPWIPHTRFEINDTKFRYLLEKCSGMKLARIQEIPEKIRFFQETQFAFSSLIASDKRDAGDNTQQRRVEQTALFSSILGRGLDEINQQLATSELDHVRTKIRKEATSTLATLLSHQESRVFCLTAPTGAGKTRILLTLAQLILDLRKEKANELLGVDYVLPFLSITEQVESVCRSLLGASNEEQHDVDQFFTRFDSRADAPSLDRLQDELDDDPTVLPKVLEEEFARRTFDYPLVVTTFVQFFETLMSNRNATLLKLPNFAKTVFLLDEIQSLPPRLYTFFVAYLDEFCRRFDSYAIVSTATMPYLKLSDSDSGKEARKHFSSYETPPQLISDSWFNDPVFNRYVVQPKTEISNLEKLAEELTSESSSSLVILNTIPDTVDLFARMPSNPDTCYLLLNTRFTPEDRRKKIDLCKKRLAANQYVTLITTQLVEAGVDIDFPVVYRDLCPFPNLIQAAGRCNRNNNGSGFVYLFELIDDKGKSRAETVYGADGNPAWFLGFTRSIFQEGNKLNEAELLDLQKRFFQLIAENLIIGAHPNLRSRENDKKESNLLACICEQAFEDVGRFMTFPHFSGDSVKQVSFSVPRTAQG